MYPLNNRLFEADEGVSRWFRRPPRNASRRFGTNFDNVPGLHSNWGFAIMMAGILGAAGGMGLFFRHRGWF
jgi:hypothetical protein